jgi:AraC-like DNA-binding protein
VGLELGYADPAHFTRAVVEWVGLPPREWRRKLCT